ncbi:MAG TPA: META domain-containing protein [Rhodanobacteraceae bacterium]|jgi:heat shock protein HslJ|nr:META domain-containing protein [Rhodanobacteraceae bacterium]
MRPVSALLMAALAVTGGAAQAARDPAPVQAALAGAPSSAPSIPNAASLDGSEWRFVELDGAAVPAGVAASLRFHDGHAAGKAGCNAYGVRYEIRTDGTARFTQTLSTKMACLQPAGAMQVERAVFNAFRKTAKVETSGGELLMLDAAGRPLAKLVRENAQ